MTAFGPDFPPHPPASPSLGFIGMGRISSAVVTVPCAGGVVILATTCCETHDLPNAMCCEILVFTPDLAAAVNPAAIAGPAARSARAAHHVKVRMSCPRLNACRQETLQPCAPTNKSCRDRASDL